MALAEVTILEKSKAQPQTRSSEDVFYKYAWFYHFKHVGPKLLRDRTEVVLPPFRRTLRQLRFELR